MTSVLGTFGDAHNQILSAGHESLQNRFTVSCCYCYLFVLRANRRSSGKLISHDVLIDQFGCESAHDTFEPLFIACDDIFGPLVIGCDDIFEPLVIGCDDIFGPLFIGCDDIFGSLVIGCDDIFGSLIIGCDDIFGPLFIGCDDSRTLLYRL